MSANSQIKSTHHPSTIVEPNEVELYFKHDSRRRAVRYITGILSGLTAVIYFLIGFNFLTVLESGDGQFFGLFAGVAYAFGMLILLTARKDVANRTFWIIGAIFQLFVIYTYFSIAPQRIPEFEVWGIILRVLQAIIFVGLLYLVIRTPRQVVDPRQYEDYDDLKDL